ncbi:MAG: hypothetical protein ACOYO1_11350 [Bacteroidales bacterium]
MTIAVSFHEIEALQKNLAPLVFMYGSYNIIGKVILICIAMEKKNGNLTLIR